MDLENVQLEEQMKEIKAHIQSVTGEMILLETQNVERNDKISRDSKALEEAKEARETASKALSDVQLRSHGLIQQDSFVEENLKRVKDERERLEAEKASLGDGTHGSIQIVKEKQSEIEALNTQINEFRKLAESFKTPQTMQVD